MERTICQSCISRVRATPAQEIAFTLANAKEYVRKAAAEMAKTERDAAATSNTGQHYANQDETARQRALVPKGTPWSPDLAGTTIREMPIGDAMSQMHDLLLHSIDRAYTVPEIGTIRATHIPQVILTSNGTRELSDALRRRCLYHYLDYPTLAREIAIVKAALPQVDTRLVEDAVQFVQRLRREDLAKIPGIAETLDWVRALFQLQHRSLPEDMSAVLGTLGCLLKTREDRFVMGPDRLRQLVEGRRTVGVAENSNEQAKVAA